MDALLPLGGLVTRGRSVALGEWRSGRLWPGRTDDSDAGLQIHATGDLVRIEADGLLRFAGRNDAQTKLHSVRVETGELEQQLLRAPGVENASAVASGSGELVAFVAMAGDRRAAIERRLRDDLRAALPRGLQPARLHVMDRIPRLSSGKVDRRQLRQLDEAALNANACSPMAA